VADPGAGAQNSLLSSTFGGCHGVAPAAAGRERAARTLYAGRVFTGIVEELGEVVGRENLGDSARLVIRGPIVTSDAGHGDSIAVNGVCLTVVDVLADGAFSADVMDETLNRSSLRGIDVGARVNLERAAALSSRLGGHIVQGHVDGTGHVISRTPSEHWTVVRIALPSALSRYVVLKGSITVDGVSLTVSGLSRDWFEVSLIPTTLELTTLGRAEVGSPVNLEVDVIAKYVERLLGQTDDSAGT
jgi:riboflavin synthase